jgi:hypothetical protein
MKELECKQLSKFMKTQFEVVKKHLDEHKYLRKLTDKNEALESFISDYGWLIREIYCSQICISREECEFSEKMKTRGDLLQDRVR